MDEGAGRAGAGPASILCVGAAHWDVIGRTRRPLPPGADVPGRVTRQPGGVARNLAEALARAGLPVALLAVVGRDDPGAALVSGLEAAGVDCRGVLRGDGPTDAYVAIEDAAGGLHAAVADCTGLERTGVALLAPLGDGRLAAPGQPWRGPVLVDGNLPRAVIAALLQGPAVTGPVAIVPASPEKSAGLAGLLGIRPVTLYLNRHEAEALCGTAFADSGAAAQALARLPGVAAVVTDGAAAASTIDDGRLVTRAPRVAAAGSVTGAGDAFVAAHLAARAQGCDAGAALERAIAAAVRHITREEA